MAKRLEKVAALLLKELNRLIRTDYQAECVRITFIHVNVSPDLRNATAFYSVVGEAEHVQAAKQFFKRFGKELGFRLGESIELRRTPVFLFRLDQSVDQVNRVLGRLDELDRKDQASETTTSLVPPTTPPFA